MCHFVSWKRNPENNAILFLTRPDLDNKRGRETAKHCGNNADLVGHGAIEFFYEIEPDKFAHEECTDFSKPSNFPAEIAEAIRAGKFRGMGCPDGLLNKRAQARFKKAIVPAQAECDAKCNAAYDEYNTKCSAAYDEYDAKCNAAWDEYDAKCNAAWDECDAKCNAAWDECNAKCNAARDEYDAKCNAAYDEYNTKCNAARDGYDAKRNDIFWDLFADSKNRVKVWR
jgi:hypothetical protein